MGQGRAARLTKSRTSTTGTVALIILDRNRQKVEKVSGNIWKGVSKLCEGQYILCSGKVENCKTNYVILLYCIF